MHFERGDPHEEAGAAELPLLPVVPEDVADVLAEEALDALAELLHAVDVGLRHLPIGAGARRERRDLPVDFVVPGNVRHEVPENRKRLHRRHDDRPVGRQRIHPGFARQPRPAVDLGRARPALARLAVPAHGEVRSEIALDVMERVQDDHSRRDRDAVLDEFSAVRRPAKDPEDRFLHGASRIVFRSGGGSGTGRSDSSMAPPTRLTTMFFFPHVGSLLAKSVRLWAPRLSSRRSALRATASETVSIAFRSRARCQPGLKSLEPSTRIRSQRSRNSRIFARPLSRSSRLRKIPTRLCIVSVRSRCTAYGLSPSGRSKNASISAVASSICRSSNAPGPVRPARSAAASPARRPKTSRSESELPPSRFAPWSPAATSPAAYRPGTLVSAVSAS